MRHVKKTGDKRENLNSVDYVLVILQRTKIGNYFVLNFNLYNCLLTEVLFIYKFTGIFTAAGQIQTILQALKCLQNNI